MSSRARVVHQTCVFALIGQSYCNLFISLPCSDTLTLALANTRPLRYSGSSDTTIRVWSGDDGHAHLYTLEGHHGTLEVASLAVGLDGKLYVDPLLIMCCLARTRVCRVLTIVISRHSVSPYTHATKTIQSGVPFLTVI